MGDIGKEGSPLFIFRIGGGREGDYERERAQLGELSIPRRGYGFFRSKQGGGRVRNLPPVQVNILKGRGTFFLAGEGPSSSLWTMLGEGEQQATDKGSNTEVVKGTRGLGFHP